MKVLSVPAMAAFLALSIAGLTSAQGRTLATSQYNHTVPQEGEHHQVPYFDHMSEKSRRSVSMSESDYLVSHNASIQHACPNQCR